MPEIWTIGHSVLPLEEFLRRLRAHGIARLVDVRRYPVSRRHPHFEARALRDALAESGIAYRHAPELGGRREPRPDSPNRAWKNPSFRGYADYMDTPAFAAAAEALAEEARCAPTVMMCSEGNWAHCHRGLISDWFRARGWRVLHIKDEHAAGEHPGTPVARAQERILPLFGEET